jgi:hypothetical protein
MVTWDEGDRVITRCARGDGVIGWVFAALTVAR